MINTNKKVWDEPNTMDIYQKSMIRSECGVLLHGDIMWGVYDSESTMSDVLLPLMFCGSHGAMG